MFGEIRNEQGERLDYTYHKGNDNRIVVIGHGVTGNKDRPALIALAEGLADAGISALRFSFSGNGDSEGEFTNSTITKEVADLGSVIDVLSDNRICYVGHSMGGAVGVLRAATDERIEVLVSLAGMVHTKAFADREFGDVTPDQGFMWDEPDCPLSQVYMDDMTAIDSVAKHASKFGGPWLLVHGSEDDIVPIQDSIDVLQFANEPTELLELSGVDHVFSDDGTPIMVEKVVAWISQKL
ncbi:MAG: alpha/beta fold hydrolase [Candidatus Poribacteria bacterium]|nr:alpha/beta fold hydrolase [Candidatus Poribacteria bacterium]